MRKLAILTAIFLLAGAAYAQTETRVRWIEVDGEEIAKPYYVMFRTGPTYVTAERTKKGFLLPPEVRGQRSLTLTVVFDKYDLDFFELDRSLFDEEWIIGVDTKPFSEEFVRREEQKGAKLAYYIRFSESPMLVTINRKKQ